MPSGSSCPGPIPIAGCDVRLDRGSLTFAGDEYTLVLEHGVDCPGRIPSRIEEAGTFVVSGRSVGLTPFGDVCGSWLTDVAARDDVLEARFAHPCLHGSIRYLRFTALRRTT